MKLYGTVNWKDNIVSKWKHFDINFRLMYWILGKLLKLSLHNRKSYTKLSLNLSELWRNSTQFQLIIIIINECFRSKLYWIVTFSPWYITNNILLRDLKISKITKELQVVSTSYKNLLVVNNLDNREVLICLYLYWQTLDQLMIYSKL